MHEARHLVARAAQPALRDVEHQVGLAHHELGEPDRRARVGCRALLRQRSRSAEAGRRLARDDAHALGRRAQHVVLAQPARVARVAELQQVREPRLAHAVALARLPHHAQRREQRVVARGERRLEPRVDAGRAGAASSGSRAPRPPRPAGALPLDPAAQQPLLEPARGVEQEHDAPPARRRGSRARRDWSRTGMLGQSIPGGEAMSGRGERIEGIAPTRALLDILECTPIEALRSAPELALPRLEGHAPLLSSPRVRDPRDEARSPPSTAARCSGSGLMAATGPGRRRGTPIPRWRKIFSAIARVEAGAAVWISREMLDFKAFFRPLARGASLERNLLAEGQHSPGRGSSCESVSRARARRAALLWLAGTGGRGADGDHHGHVRSAPTSRSGRSGSTTDVRRRRTRRPRAALRGAHRSGERAWCSARPRSPPQRYRRLRARGRRRRSSSSTDRATRRPTTSTRSRSRSSATPCSLGPGNGATVRLHPT